MFSKKLLVIAAAAGAIFAATADSGSASTMSSHHHKYSVKGYVGADFYSKFKGATNANIGTTAAPILVSYAKKHPKSNAAYGIAVGYEVDHNFTAALDFSFREPKYSNTATVATVGYPFSTKIKTYTLFLNGMYDVVKYGSFTPYVTAGIGYANVKAGSTSVNGTAVTFKKDNNFAWNVGLGSKYKINHNFDADLSYKYISLGKLKNKQSLPKMTVAAQEVALGLIYKF